MDSAGPAKRWRFLISPRWLAWHAFAVVAFWGMFWLGNWQLHRALAGNGLSWAYTFEWPIFAIMGAIFWAKTIRDEFRIRAGEVTPAPPPDLPAGAATPPGVTTMAGSTPDAAAEEPEDEELAAYNAYLARLNSEVKGHGRWHGFR
jgi:hypothetical protein